MKLSDAPSPSQKDLSLNGTFNTTKPAKRKQDDTPAPASAPAPPATDTARKLAGAGALAATRSK
jgi:hypothetical protein